MKFTNNSNVSIHITGYGWVKPSESISVPKEDTKTINSIKGLSFFNEESGAASPPKGSAKKSSKA